MPKTNTFRLSRRTVLAASALLLSGCGWHLRGRQDVPLETLYVDLPKNSTLRATIKRNLEAQTDVKVVDEQKDAQATLTWFGSKRSTQVLAVNSKGRARIYSLKLAISFAVKLNEGVELIPETRLSTTRELNWDEGDYNGRIAEENLLFQEMEQNLVNRVVTRLAHISPELVESRASDLE